MITNHSQLEAIGRVTEPAPKPRSGMREVAIKIGHTLKTVIHNTTTLTSDRIIEMEYASQAPSINLAAVDMDIDGRIEAYLSAPMNADGTHPDPSAPEYNLFG